ncbi:hypothetical protein [Flavobacterium sp.]|uniref:hypothetical protein n=1 Tax=Flavobacterium sp. TaxID=239 RepID=UPI0026235CBE|nr:hypothetical protein [Flavobacterium sp.]
MRENLSNTLLAWKNDDNKIGVRRVLYSKLNISEGEYLITISEELIVGINNKNREIKVNRKFPTYAQSENNNNPNGDVYRAKEITNEVTKEFNKLHNEAINELFQDYDGQDEEL